MPCQILITTLSFVVCAAVRLSLQFFAIRNQIEFCKCNTLDKCDPHFDDLNLIFGRVACFEHSSCLALLPTRQNSLFFYRHMIQMTNQPLTCDHLVGVFVSSHPSTENYIHFWSRTKERKKR